MVRNKRESKELRESTEGTCWEPKPGAASYEAPIYVGLPGMLHASEVFAWSVAGSD